jgi:predicted nucleic acid-binding protein
MNLADFSGEAEIFVDANIFTYFALGTPVYQDACAEFLQRVEGKQIHAVTSDFVLNEVFYALLVGKGSELLATTKITTIKKRLTEDASLSAACYQVCEEFWGYLLALQAEGLRVVSVGAREQERSLALGSRYRLLPTDALHVATCQQYGVAHFATADAHFERVDFLQIWQPEAK